MLSIRLCWCVCVCVCVCVCLFVCLPRAMEKNIFPLPIYLSLQLYIWRKICLVSPSSSLSHSPSISLSLSPPSLSMSLTISLSLSLVICFFPLSLRFIDVILGLWLFCKQQLWAESGNIEQQIMQKINHGRPNCMVGSLPDSGLTRGLHTVPCLAPG